MSEILKPLKMILCSSREILLLKFQKTCRPPVYYTGSNEPSHAPKFEWPDNTFKSTWKCYQRVEFFCRFFNTYNTLRCQTECNFRNFLKKANMFEI